MKGQLKYCVGPPPESPSSISAGGEDFFFAYEAALFKVEHQKVLFRLLYGKMSNVTPHLTSPRKEFMRGEEVFGCEANWIYNLSPKPGRVVIENTRKNFLNKRSL